MPLCTSSVWPCPPTIPHRPMHAAFLSLTSTRASFCNAERSTKANCMRSKCGQRMAVESMYFKSLHALWYVCVQSVHSVRYIVLLLTGSTKGSSGWKLSMMAGTKLRSLSTLRMWPRSLKAFRFIIRSLLSLYVKNSLFEILFWRNILRWKTLFFHRRLEIRTISHCCTA